MSAYVCKSCTHSVSPATFTVYRQHCIEPCHVYAILFSLHGFVTLSTVPLPADLTRLGLLIGRFQARPVQYVGGRYGSSVCCLGTSWDVALLLTVGCFQSESSAEGSAKQGDSNDEPPPPPVPPKTELASEEQSAAAPAPAATEETTELEAKSETEPKPAEDKPAEEKSEEQPAEKEKEEKVEESKPNEEKDAEKKAEEDKPAEKSEEEKVPEKSEEKAPEDAPEVGWCWFRR